MSRVEINGLLHVPYCDTLQIADCEMQCQSKTLAELTTVPDSEAVLHYQFWMFAVLMALSWIGMAVVVSIGDAICFSILGKFV